MDPQQQIIDALVKAAVTVTADATTATLKAAYSKVKEMITKRFGSAGRKLERLEAEPENEDLKAVLAENVRDSDMDQDPEILTALAELIAELKKQPGGFSEGAPTNIKLNVSGSNHMFTATGDINIGGDFHGGNSNSSD
ncbi:hypothetical protein HQ496_02040 [bacterium]|nr:hypothetical protein [bacterium]